MRTYYHGTSARLQPGDLIRPGHEPNWERRTPRRVYFTSETAMAMLYALEAAMRTDGRTPHVYQVRPLAKRVHRDDAWCALYELRERGTRWSGRPVAVVAELALPRELWLMAAELVDQATAAGLTAPQPCHTP